jgi:hypothetical protein
MSANARMADGLVKLLQVLLKVLAHKWGSIVAKVTLSYHSVLSTMLLE